VTAVPNVAATRVVEPTLTLVDPADLADPVAPVCNWTYTLEYVVGAVPLKIPSAALATVVLNE
jgi:hypothetical protein